MQGQEAMSRAADRRILEYFISLNSAAADQWEALGATARHQEVRDLLVHTATLERKFARSLADLLPRFIAP